MKFFAFIFFFSCISIAVSQNRIDSLLQVFNEKKDTTAVNAGISLCIDYSAFDNKKAIYYGKKAFLLAEKLNFESGIANASKEIAISYYYLSMPDSSEFYLEIAHKIFKKLNKKRLLANVLVLEGIIFDYKALKNKSMQKYLEAIEIYESINDLSGLSVAYSNIALVYHRQKDFDRALQYQLKSLEIAQKLKSNYSICVSMMNIGLVYEEKNQLDKALEYYFNAEKIVNKLGNKQFEAILYNNIGLLYFKKKNYNKANLFYKKSLELKLQLDNKSSIATTMYNIARIHLEQNNFDSTKFFIDQCTNIALECGDLKNLSNSYDLNYQNYKRIKDFEKALFYLEKYKQTEDSLNKITYDEKLNELQIFYNSAEDAKTIQKLNLEKNNQILKNQNQKIIIFSVILFLLLAIVGGVYIYFAYRNKLKLNKILEEQNHEIEAQKRSIEEKNIVLEEQKMQLSELDEIKTRFFTNVSHEFRTPLTLIISPIKSLIEKNEYPIIKKELEIVKRNAIRLQNLINEILDLSKLDQKSMKLKLVESDLSEFIRNIVGAFESYVQSKEIELLFKAEERIFVAFDSEKIEKIIINLISNSIKHTKSGGKIIVELLQKSESIEISVSDSGKGISESELSKIFDRFYMVENSEERQNNSSGIGLSLVKELVEFHKGKIEVTSKLGIGTKFLICLPKIYSQESEITKKNKLNISEIFVDFNEEIENQTSKGEFKILLVEDNIDMQNYLAKYLGEIYSIDQAFDGEQGIKKATENEYEIIISDVMMPKMNGYEMTQKLKENAETCHIPIILLTAKADEESILEAFEQKADDYIVKPFNLNELKARIKSHIDNRKILIEKFKKNINIEFKEIASSSVDEVFLNKAAQVVEKHLLDTDFDAEKFAEEMNVSRTSLHRKLKALTNTSATEFIRILKLKKAANMLKNNVGNVSEVAFSCGFNNLSYFTKCFKDYFGVTPTDFNS